MDVKTSHRAPFYIFRQNDVILFKNIILDFFGNFSKSPKGHPDFFSYFATKWSFTKPKGSPFTILSLRYSADFGRSRFHQTFIKSQKFFELRMKPNQTRTCKPIIIVFRSNKLFSRFKNFENVLLAIQKTELTKASFTQMVIFGKRRERLKSALF